MFLLPPGISIGDKVAVPMAPPQKYARPNFQKTKIDSRKRKIDLRLIVPELWRFYLQKIS